MKLNREEIKTGFVSGASFATAVTGVYLSNELKIHHNSNIVYSLETFKTIVEICSMYIVSWGLIGAVVQVLINKTHESSN